MQLKTRTWFLISLSCFILAGVFWHLGDERSRRDALSDQANSTAAVTAIKELGAGNFHHAPLLSPVPAALNPPHTNAAQAARSNPLLTNRLSNTARTLEELMRSDSAVLLRNALIDTSVTNGLAIPAHLRAEGDPGSYIVQSRGALDEAFRSRLNDAGAAIVSYIPNNAYLVRASEAGANQLRSLPETQSVLPWEPYYKLDLALLALAVESKSLPEGANLNVLVFPGERDAGLKSLEALGAKLLGEDRSPFGHKLIVEAPSGILPALAALPVVELVQVHRSRQLLNDLTRPRIGVATNSTTAPNYLGLSGNGVLVDMNDTGVDKSHPDFDTRVFGDTINATIDPDGHGTHVAGTIIGSGSMSSSVTKTPPGSPTNANFRGMAPKAKLFVSQIDLVTGPLISDTYLQEIAALTNAFISNNSWGYDTVFDYDDSAASYDAAVRDAIPRQTGPQPVLFVFAAGNSGEGDGNGLGPRQETIVSPATSKNGITVGAIEKLRGSNGIPNEYVNPDGTTNRPFALETDSDHQVAFFSSRGNVGIGLEGAAGRFKPDLVAPGEFVISCRASGWKSPSATPPNVAQASRINGQVVLPGKTNAYEILLPDNAVRLAVITRSNQFSPAPFPALPLYAKADSPPDLTNDFIANGSFNIPVTPGLWFYAVGNQSRQAVNYDLITVVYLQDTNVNTSLIVLSNLNSDLDPWYRYERGTSQAAPAVSGVLALMQEFFEQRLGLTKDENWPALMKAMLINGARSVGQEYSLQVQNSINYQGWGVVNLTNSLPSAMNGGPSSESTWPVAIFHTNRLYTGQSDTRKVAIAPFARTAPLRFTLVWTDPPGNPGASVKLVNDLDLIVTNTVTGEVYIGNNIPQGSDFNDVTTSSDTNAPLADVVNNVENVFINRPVGSNYTVIVRAHRVNVNAVTGQTNGILQDYALVISSGNSLLTNAITISDVPVVPQLPYDPGIFVKGLSNGVPLLFERVGANNPLLNVLNNGVTNQWNFYVYTNTTTLTNVAFATFAPYNLSRTRFRDADLDLYASPNPALTNLDATVIADAINGNNGGRSSRNRGGTELIIYTNVKAGDVFYLGVKSEDQQGGEFGIFGMAFDDLGRDSKGNIRLVFMPAPVAIPDGTPEAPQAVDMFAFVLDPAKVRRIVLTNTFTHENAGDLFGILTHPTASAASAVLNNHRSFAGTQTFLYDDSQQNSLPGSEIPDGPGRLRDFRGELAAGMWRFTMIDNAPFHVGQVDSLVGYIEPQKDLTNPNGILVSARAKQWGDCQELDVPFGVTNVVITVEPPSTVEVYIRLGDCPDAVNYDKKASIDPPGGVMSFGLNDSPGLQPGNKYFINYFNPSSSDVTVRLRAELQYGLTAVASQTYNSSDTPKLLPDDAVTNSIIVVTNNRIVADLRVGMRVDHPRLSDLVFHLVNPQGTRILLSENRGGFGATNYGLGLPVTYVVPFTSTGGPEEVRTNIDTGQRSGLIQIVYDFFQIPDEIRVYYDGNRIFDSGLISGAGTFSINYGPGLSTVVTIVMNEGGSKEAQTQWHYQATITGPWNYATFTDNTNLAGPIKFGVPPYFTLPTNRIVFSNSFESVNMLTNQTNFAQMDSFENWTVVTNGVAVLSDTNHPYAALTLGSTNWGTNFLALSSGQLSLSLSNIVVPDHDYVLNFVQRKVSSSPTQNMAIGISVTADIFEQLNVTNQFLGGQSRPVWANKVRLCPGQEVLITADPGSEGDTNNLVAGLPIYSLIGCFSFSSEMLTSNTVASVPFYIGTNMVVTAPTQPGDYYLFLGVNNNNFNNPPPSNASGFYNATAWWQQCQYSSGQVMLGANAIPITGSANWKVESRQFLANSTMTNLVLQPDINTTLLFDSFEIDELVSTVYYQSEEPMTPFVGQSALGDWRLEVWDNRAGAGMSSTNVGTLFSWSLRFTFADSPAAIPLTNGVPYTNFVSRDQIKYFVVAVPDEVTMANNTLIATGAGAGVELLYSPFGLPIGQSPPDPVGPVPSPFLATTTSPVGATLPQGRFYYLGVRNVDPTEVNTFTIRADFNIRVTPLLNGIPILNELISSNPYPFLTIRDNPSIAVTNMNYYYFDVTSTDVISTTVSVIPADGNVNLVLRRALPVVDLFPRPTFFDYESTQPSLGNDLIIVNSNSLPVKLSPGRWYVGVYNTVPDANVHYDIVATQSTAPLWSYVDLADSTPTNFTALSSDTLTNFFRFVVAGTNSGVVFEIFGLNSADADLLVKRSDLPAPDLYDFSFLQDFGADELIALRTNIFIPNLNATNWFLQIVNRDLSGNPVTGMVCAKVTDASNLLFSCQGTLLVTSAPIPGGPFTFTWNSVPGEKYAVEMTANLKIWGTTKIITATGTKTSFKTTAPHAGPPHFYRVKQVAP